MISKLTSWSIKEREKSPKEQLVSFKLYYALDHVRPAALASGRQLEGEEDGVISEFVFQSEVPLEPGSADESAVETASQGAAAE